MKNIVRNFVIFMLSAIIITTYIVPVSANRGTVSLISDAQSKSLIILGTISDQADIPYVVNVSGYSEDVVVFSSGNRPLMSMLYTTKEGGRIGSSQIADLGYAEQIKLREDFPAGHYLLHIFYEENGQNKREAIEFYVLNADDPGTINFLAELNASSASETTYKTYLCRSDGMYLEKIGINYNNIKTSIEFAAKYAFEAKTEDYTIYNLPEKLWNGDMAYTLKTSGVDGVSSNTYLLGTGYSEYSALSSGEKASIKPRLDLLLANADYTVGTLAEIFAEKYVVARVTISNTIPTLTSAINANASKLGLTLISGNYSQIPEAMKYMVYEKMLTDGISNLESYADITSSFNGAAKYVLDNLTKSDNTIITNRVSGLGGGGGYTQSAPSDILNPDKAEELFPEGSNLTPKPQFNDISGSYAQGYITKLASKGIISGYGDGSFRPNDNITRAEYAKLISLAFKISTKSDVSFADISDEWFAEYVISLAGENIITGYDGSFRPYDNIKREDAVVILKRVIDKLKLENNESNRINYADKNQISDYALAAIEQLTTMGIVKGDGANINPLNPITRAEVATVLGRVYELYEAKEAADK